MGAPLINWYRSPVARGDLKRLLRRSDLSGWVQTGGFCAVLLLTGSATAYALLHATWWLALPLLFLHGMVGSFSVNAVHELNHGTVFASTRLNRAWVHLFAFLGFINHEVFQASHVRHHRYTLHPPADLEVVLPIILTPRDFLLAGFLNVRGFAASLKEHCRWALGRFAGEWELELYPPADATLRVVPVRWSRILLGGHAAILVGSLALGLWFVPLLVSLPRFYGGWLFFLCNNTQHIAVQGDAADFRLSCRTFTLNPLVGFLYWHMNFHTDHHMYPGIPCYRLAALHRLIREDLPTCAHGIVAVWREIAVAQRSQRKRAAA